MRLCLQCCRKAERTYPCWLTLFSFFKSKSVASPIPVVFWAQTKQFCLSLFSFLESSWSLEPASFFPNFLPPTMNYRIALIFFFQVRPTQPNLFRYNFTFLLFSSFRRSLSQTFQEAVISGIIFPDGWVVWHEYFNFFSLIWKSCSFCLFVCLIPQPARSWTRVFSPVFRYHIALQHFHVWAQLSRFKGFQVLPGKAPKRVSKLTLKVISH